jgi:four helix bundle protein
MNPQAETLKARTKKFALDVLAFIDTFAQRGGATTTIGQQLSDAATAVAANYRATCRARSDAEFAAKIGGVLEEADESLFWLELAHARKI